MNTINAGNPLVIEYLRSYLQQVVTIHHAMFEKLLFQNDGITIELAELFEEAGRAYLDISDQLNRSYQNLQIEV
jgi:hypothetical protein